MLTLATSATKEGKEGMIIPNPVESMTMVMKIKMSAFLDAILEFRVEWIKSTQTFNFFNHIVFYT